MSLSVLYLSMSFDGYIAGPDDFLDGDDGQRPALPGRAGIARVIDTPRATHIRYRIRR
jgi:hypothetical protein